MFSKISRFVAALLLFLTAPLHAHVVNDFYAELSSDGDVVRMDILLDTSYATPEGNIEDKPQQPRSWLYTLSEAQHKAMRDKASEHPLEDTGRLIRRSSSFGD